ncbi:MAG: glycosyl hydrolase family 95 catalytic domain-containing protein [Bryobacteraceae bacterium]
MQSLVKRAALVLSAVLPLAAADAPQLWYRSPATEWAEALPIGNGRIGAMVFGGVDTEHLQLNEETIYAGKQMDRVNPEARANIRVIRRMLLEGKVMEAQQLAQRTVLAVPPRQPPYEPLGDLTINFKDLVASQVTNFRRSLDLYDGVARIDFDANGAHFSRTAFASYPDGAVIVHLKASRPGALSFSVAMSRVQDAQSKTSGKDTVVLEGKAMPPATKDKRYDDEPRTGVVFAGAVKVISDGKIGSGSGTDVQIEGSTESTLILTASTDIRSAHPDQECWEQLQRVAMHSYEELLARHKADFRTIATRVSLVIGNGAQVAKQMPTDALLQRAQSGTDDAALASLYFAFGRYLLQSSSRANSWAANLQGKWNDKLDPPWGSKYTININTEMNYWPAEVCNLGETVEGLYNLIERMMPSGQRAAKEMYGTPGFVAHHNTDGWGDTEAIDGVSSGVWPFGAAWLSLTLWDHYDYSGDTEYLRGKAYPVMRAAAVYLLNNLFADGAGHLVSGPSLSPENRYYTPDHQKASLDVSPTMDLEITTALFKRVIEASKTLSTDDELRRRLSETLPKLIPLQIGHFGQLQEWRKDYEEAEPGHRHLSHLFAIYPAHELTPATPDFYKAARVALERRLASGGGGTGWSRAWVVCLWATFHEGDKADESLRVLFNHSTWKNLFDLHPPGIFQIDGNLGATAGIAEMLMQSDGKAIELLPALPSSWKEGTVTGLRARRGLTVDASWKDGRVVAATLHAERPGTYELKADSASLPKKTITVILNAGESKHLTF